MSESIQNQRKTAMNSQEFTCSECGQEIDVNESMRKAILTNGCPVCTAPADESDFEQ